MKQRVMKFKPLIDGSTWSVIALIVVCCAWPLLLETSWVEILILICAAIVCIMPFFSIWYEIDGGDLVVYQFFRPARFPISKIKAVSPTKTLLSAPATSLKRRIAITFVDRSVLKSSMPLVISPANQSMFIEALLSVNPDITVVSNK